MTPVIPQGDEAEFQVKPLGIVVQRMDLDRSNADVFGDKRHASQGIHEKPLPQPLPLGAFGDRQPPQQHDGHIDLRQPLGFLLRQRIERNLMAGDAIIAKDSAVAGNGGNVCPRQVSPIVLTGKLTEPMIQFGLTAIKRRSVVRRSESVNFPSGA